MVAALAAANGSLLDSQDDASSEDGWMASSRSQRVRFSTDRAKNERSADIKNNRQIRNRESAIRYRERKASQLQMLQDRTEQLEQEVAYLRARLSAYEVVPDMDCVRHTATAATF